MSSSTPRPRQSGGSKRTPSTSRSKSRKAKPTGKERFRALLKYLLIAGVVFTVLMVSIFYFAYRSTKIPDPNQAFQAQTTNIYYAGGHTKIGRFATQNRESVPLSEVAQVMQDAVVAAEDRTFWTNKGIDAKGILRAAFSNAQGNATQGASTITQQYVKILYLTQQRTFKRKIKEAFLSLKIHNQQSKSQILEGYLNTIYFGRGAYGIQAAANAYFGVQAKDLNASQAAMLAAVLNSPNYLSPDRSADSRAALLNRYDYVLNGMVTAKTLDSAKASQISGRLPKFKKPSTSNLYGGQKGFMLDMVKAELLKLGFDEAQIDGGGLKVTTTFTPTAMNAAKAGIMAEEPTGLRQLHAAAASVDVKTGALLGFYAGQDYLKSQLNWASIGDSPGSSFKPFALAAGLEAGFQLTDTFQGSSPYRFPSGLSVKNEGQGDGHSYGAKVDLIKATQESINTAYVDLTASIPDGPQKVMNTAIKMGIPANTPGLRPEATIALGSATVSPINMANAYSTIADGGLEHPTYVVAKVTQASDGKVLYTAPKKTTRAISADIASNVSYALQQTVKGGTGTAAMALARPAAGKTGTATKTGGDVISSWFVGFTPQVATAVMYVRGNGRQTLEGYLNPFYGATYPTRTWTAIMKLIMDGTSIETFPPPAKLTGKAPAHGHDPYTPPPKKTKKPTPTITPTLTPSPTITPTTTPTPTITPSGTPTDVPTCGGLLQPPC
ncbi:MAG: glycosyl transferase, family 51 [Marmoricola sp.]|nr:glycosyl transferase, family 51 [Marmoricola sp.]